MENNLQYDAQELVFLAALKNRMVKVGETNSSPFDCDDVVRYRTDISPYDVPEIHSEARDAIAEYIRRVRSKRQSQIAILIGDPGMGKSHLVNYFRSHIVANQLGYLMVSGDNIWTIDEFEPAILDWLVSALTYPDDFLLSIVTEIGYQALSDILQNKRINEIIGRSHRGIFGVFRKSSHEVIEALVRNRDSRVFRKIDFRKFSKFVCNRYLHDPGNNFHRYAMNVLLQYLVEENRELVLQWLRRKPVGKQFLESVGSDENIASLREAMSMLKLLIGMFTTDVVEALSNGNEEKRCSDKIVFVTIDQTESKNLIFKNDEDWHRFFGRLSELYNSLPNVFILFTMTNSNHKRLRPKMEQQFQERIPLDERLVVKMLQDSDIERLYRKRMQYWLENVHYDGDLGIENTLLPFDHEYLRSFDGAGYSIRETLRAWDSEFQKRLVDLIIEVPLDYNGFFRNSRRVFDDPKVSEHEYTQKHYKTIKELFSLLPEHPDFWSVLGNDEIQIEYLKQLKSDIPKGLVLEFRSLRNTKRWAKIYIVKFSRNYRDLLKPTCALLYNKKKPDNHRLFVVRAKSLAIPSEITGNSARLIKEITYRVEEEAILQCCILVLKNRTKYTQEQWDNGLVFLADKLRQTYFGKLFSDVKQILGLSGATTGAGATIPFNDGVQVSTGNDAVLIAEDSIESDDDGSDDDDENETEIIDDEILSGNE